MTLHSVLAEINCAIFVYNRHISVIVLMVTVGIISLDDFYIAFSE